MESFVPPTTADAIAEFVAIAKRDPKAELECKLLSGKIHTKDVADRLIERARLSSYKETDQEPYLNLSYPDNIRVTVTGTHNIQKVCNSGTLKGVPVAVQKKERYFTSGTKDVIDIPEIHTKFTLRSETDLRKDWDRPLAQAHWRLITRKSFDSAVGSTRIDVSMVRSKSTGTKTIRDLLKQPTAYELEIEYVHKEAALQPQTVTAHMLTGIREMLGAYYQTADTCVLHASDIERYKQEFKGSGHVFYNPVTLMRKHIRAENPFNIGKGYTVTNKADGERSALYVARDKRVLKVTPTGQVTWTGFTDTSNTHVGDFVDGEYIAGKNLFCIFDVYRFRSKDVRALPLMTTDEDIVQNPQNSRLGCAKLFIEDLKTRFTSQFTMNPFRVETKLFMAGDGETMEQAIQTMLKTEFEYKTDGLILTPRSSPVAPASDRAGKTWLRVYKWKPSYQNSIDFLVRIQPAASFDPVLKVPIKRGELYVSRNAGDDIVYPRETMNGEYVPKQLPSEMQHLAASNVRVPSVFQPATPRDPTAYQIVLPLSDKGVPVDEEGNRIDDNTIVECAYDTDTRRWSVMRTRYDKTYQYKVLNEPQYGNDIATANSIWTSMHVPITEDMVTTFHSTPIDDTQEDDMYYRDDLKRKGRAFEDVYAFHNRIKDQLYKSYLVKSETLLELASGRGGDLLKWKRARPSKVVGVDISLANITSPTQGAAVRYIKEKRTHPQDYLPPVLFVQGDMSKYPLFGQEDKYMPVLMGDHKGSTPYLEQFEGLSKFDAVSCQFAMHYACESEETFREFAKNIKDTCNSTFFGTCSDGKSIYSLLLGKKTHYFGSDRQVSGEYTKEYIDKDTWVEEFGMPVRVFLESFDRPAIEYLVPFDRVTEIMDEMGFDLVESKLFNEIYSQQTKDTLTEPEQTFSFLNRTFVFKRRPEEESTTPKFGPMDEESTTPKFGPEAQTVDIPVFDLAAEPAPEAPKKRKLRKKEVEPEVEAILFAGADESKGEYRNFSAMSEHPVEIDGVKYPTVEHYYQAMKATLFKDEDSLKKILKTKTAKAVKAVGKKVTGFVKELWDAGKDAYMETGMRTKFVQHPEIRKQLLDTGDKVIGFADARDTYWSIGTSMTTEKAKFPSKWRGQNKLGKLLMQMRDDFRAEQS
jgi:ribA/ribD-fused uncharacterized protein